MSQRLSNKYLQYGLVLSSMLCSAAIAIFLIGCGGHDDTHISFWPAYTLANFGDIVNYNGENLEQSSSLLWVLLLAAINLFAGVEISTLGYSLSLIFGLLVTPVIFFSMSHYLSVEQRVAFVLAIPLVLAWQFWMVSGMEMPLYALLLFLLLMQLLKADHDWRKLVPLLLSILIIRPEAPLVILGFLALVSLEQALRKTETSFLKVFVFCLVSFAAIFLLRKLYFSFGFPLPVYSKVVWEPSILLGGLSYLLRPFITDLYFIPVGILALWSLIRGFNFRFEQETKTGFFYLSHRLIILQFLFIVFSGGDWMRLSRFIIPVLPLLLLLMIDSLSSLKGSKQIIVSVAAVVSMTVSTVLNIGPGVVSYPWWITKSLQQEFPSDFNYFEYSSREHFSNIFILPVLENVVSKSSDQLGRPAIILSGQMGMTAYYLAQKQYRNFYFYDRYSLVSKDFHACEEFKNWRGRGLGQQLEYTTLAKRHNTFWDDCGLKRPDIIYDIWAGDLQPIESMGYEVVYAQHGQITTNDYLSPRVVLKGQVIAVDKKLLEKLPELKTDNFIFETTDFAKRFLAD